LSSASHPDDPEAYPYGGGSEEVQDSRSAASESQAISHSFQVPSGEKRRIDGGVSFFIRGVCPVVETSLAEIFSGDIPRIENMVIVLDQLAKVQASSLLGWSAQSLGEYLVGFNIEPIMIKRMKEVFPTVNFVLIVKAEGGFRIECGDLPESFKGTFFLEYRVSFKGRDLPDDSRRVLKQVKEIKELQDELAKGKVGFTAYGMTGTLWARVQGLNQMVDSSG
jgi:hypothetical protein